MSEKKTNAVVNYFQESVMELKRVTWPTSKQAFRLTVIVLGFCIVAMVFIGLLDTGFSFGYSQLLVLAGK